MKDNFELPPLCACADKNRLCADSTPAKDHKARYYDAGGIETLDVIKAKLSPEQYKGWLLGNLIKYSCRANHKGCFARDIDKVCFYGTELFYISGASI